MATSGFVAGSIQLIGRAKARRTAVERGAYRLPAESRATPAYG
jgi:hypothetical protein